MDVYLVGGAVRDQLLNRPVKEKDWVVVGSSVEAMKARGFRQIGRDFPVFLHPITKEEYALARTERKFGVGHQGFKCYADPSVTLEEDLRRRDLTINAIARSPQGRLIDPYGGQEDLKHFRLKHVSAEFSEDPLRILRVARFQAQLAPLPFSIDLQTIGLIKTMLSEDVLYTLSKERIWKETEKALSSPYFLSYFNALIQLGAYSQTFPDLLKPDAIAPTALMAIPDGSALSEPERFAVWVLKAFPNFKITHPLDLKKAMIKAKIPKRYIDLSIASLIASQVWRDWVPLSCSWAPKLVEAFYRMDLWRKPSLLEPVLKALGQVAPSQWTRDQQFQVTNSFIAAKAIRLEQNLVSSQHEIVSRLRSQREKAVYERLQGYQQSSFTQRI